MSALDFLLPWDSQPQGVISGNSEHLYAPYLADAWNIDSKAFVGAFRGTKGAQAGTGTALALKTTGGGIGVYAPSTSASLKLTSSLSIGTADYFAQVTFTAANYYSLGSGINVIAGYGKGWGIAGLWIYLDSSSAFTVSMDAGATTVSRAALTVGRTYTATVFSIGSVAYAYLDGVLLGTASKTTPNETGNAGFYVAADEPLVNSALRSYAGAIHAAAVGIGTLNSGVAAFAGSYPWQLFAPRSIWIPVSAGGGGISGTLATTNANDTSAASGTTTVLGTLARTNASDTSAASGTTTILGTVAATNGDDTAAASGTVGSSGSTGTVNYTNANDTAAATGTTTVTGTVARSNADDSVSASGWVGAITGTLAATNANDTVSASGIASSGVAGGGGYLPSFRRKTRKEIHAERVRLGILPEQIRKAAQKVIEKAAEQGDPQEVYEDNTERYRTMFLREIGATKWAPDYARAIRIQLELMESDAEDALLLM